MAVSGEKRFAVSPPYGPAFSLERFLIVSAFLIYHVFSYFLDGGALGELRPYCLSVIERATRADFCPGAEAPTEMQRSALLLEVSSGLLQTQAPSA